MHLNRRLFLNMLTVGGASVIVSRALPVWAAEKVKPTATSALVVIDVQNCFVTGGTLPVKNGEEVVPVINKIATAFENVVLTQDWHPMGHASFASAHSGKKPFETTKLSYGDQVMWPDHCVQGSADANLHQDLKIPQAQLIIRKGFHKDMDSYSAFDEADHKTPTGLDGYLSQRHIKEVFIVGLATDFCVAWTAMDARRKGYQTYVVEDACRGINLNGSLDKAWEKMLAAGVKRISSADIDMSA